MLFSIPTEIKTTVQKLIKITVIKVILRVGLCEKGLCNNP